VPKDPFTYFSNRRGYVKTRITPDELRADFQVLPFVSSPGAPALTGASFVVADREPTLHPV
jgi:alkaline phosphatase D